MSAFQITPFGLAIIVIYSFAIGSVALFLGRQLKDFRWRWWMLAPPALVLLALPWAEEAWIAWHFHQACKDAGVKVYRTVEVEGYLNAATSIYERQKVSLGPQFPNNPTELADFEKQGFRYFENLLTDGGARHLERVDDKVIVTLLDKPEARYHVVYHHRPTRHRYEEPIGWRLEKTERQVIDSQTGEILGRSTTIRRWYPMVDAIWIGLFGSYPKVCPGPQSPLSTPQPPFPQSVLKPASHS
ncbi:MAG: hypothetical protein LBE81_06230 [Azonexus sp.]|uniref:hypothetical protein n=1 Tax=Azonexus sp. TaxID=1872668 RepID=UPI002824BE61|nr:hypothetical protein [Azonexus sp.]MDR0776219.1 hypothetical protein [Azonexus sp.]